MKKLLACILAAACMVGLLGGCAEVAEIADSVVDAAVTELTNQVKSVLEEYKVEVVEIQPVFGKLNDEGGKYQFFCGALIKTNSEKSASDCAEAMGKLFEEHGLMVQSGAEVESPYLVHKTVTYKNEDYSEGNYYTVYVYSSDLTKTADKANAETEG